MDSKNQPQASTPAALNVARTLAGAAAGGLAGYFAFGWLVNQGFYALALPGVLLGLGGGFCALQPTRALTVICGIAAAGLGVFSEWRHFPFVADNSFGYFLAHLADLRPLTWIMLALGTGAGAWFVWRGGPVQRPREIPPTTP